MVWRIFCYFSSTSSSEINECKRESLNGMIEEEKELFDITPSGDHLFCGKMSISKAEDSSCHVSLRFMSDKLNHNIKHYHGTIIKTIFGRFYFIMRTRKGRVFLYYC